MQLFNGKLRDLGTSRFKKSRAAPVQSWGLSFAAWQWGFVGAFLCAGDGDTTWIIADELLRHQPDRFAEFRGHLQVFKTSYFPKECPDKSQLENAIQISAACGQDLMGLLRTCHSTTAAELLSDLELHQLAAERGDSKEYGEYLLFKDEQRGPFYSMLLERFDNVKQIFKETSHLQCNGAYT